MAIQACLAQIKIDLSVEGISDDARESIERGLNRRVYDALLKDVSTLFDWTSAYLESGNNYSAAGTYKLPTEFGEVRLSFWKFFQRGNDGDEDGFGITSDEHDNGAVLRTSSGKKFNVAYGNLLDWNMARSALQSLEQAVLQKLDADGILFEEFYDHETNVLHIPEIICKLAKEQHIEKLNSEKIAGKIEVIKLFGYDKLSEKLVVSLILGLPNLKKIVVTQYANSLEHTFQMIEKLKGVKIELGDRWT